ncbi:TIGR02301 family protein [Mesorhizobium sp. KR9-304]|uniref:TIGR02301 family protein n=1 Tax=Mesorhizobium sp. KR9-304 TaxID=3156614 RepID=UPI0032B4BCF6
MRRLTTIMAALVLIAPLALSRPAAALDAPYEAGLLRIAEVMGSLHFLRNLCGDKGNQWRSTMERLLAAENPVPERRARFIASFNRGYRSFESTYTKCTASATEAISRYTIEGENLARDLAARYGN